MMNTTPESVAVTSAFWNMDKCPVPPGFDARLVGPCIKRFLEKSGYSGPLTITALVPITDPPSPEVLQAVSSSGIVLHIVAYGSLSFSSLVFSWTAENDPPANVMVITDPTDVECRTDMNMLKQDGYNIIKPYQFVRASTNGECRLWENFLMEESRALEEEDADKCIETGWVCSLCRSPDHYLGVTGKGFESFCTHISSEEHAESISYFLTFSLSHDDDDDEDYIEYEKASRAQAVSHSWPGESFPNKGIPAYAPTIMGLHQPKMHPHMFATPNECPRCFAIDMFMIQQKMHPHMSATPSECPCCFATTMEMIQAKTWEWCPSHSHMFATPSEPHGKYGPKRKRKRF